MTEKTCFGRMRVTDLNLLHFLSHFLQQAAGCIYKKSSGGAIGKKKYIICCSGTTTCHVWSRFATRGRG